jgi:hypothetical protein
MGKQYANITLFGVEQDLLLDHLTRLGCNSYASPTRNNYTVMYDMSFQSAVGSIDELKQVTNNLLKSIPRMVATDQQDAYRDYLTSLFASNKPSQQGFIDLRQLDLNSESILNHYRHLPEGNLACWCSHLSKRFSCIAFAAYLRGEHEFWYHLSQNGEMLDEYTTYAPNGWRPGEPILLSDQGVISGGDPQKLCSAFNQNDKVEEVESILRKPYSAHLSSCVEVIAHEELLGLAEFPNGSARHQALSMALAMPYLWTVEVSYEAIVDDELIEFAETSKSASIFNDKEGQFKQTRITSQVEEMDNLIDSNRRESLALYCNQIKSSRNIADYDLDALVKEVERLIERLYVQSQHYEPEVLSSIQLAILHDCPFTKAGRFSTLEYILIIAEILCNPRSHQLDRISQLAFNELSRVMDSMFLSPGGVTWKQYKPVLALWIAR